jgi:hypothetical protein
MLFGTYQSGGAVELGLNVFDIRRGGEIILMDGTETVATGSASVHFSAGPDPQGGGVINTAFYVQGCSGGTEWTIQASDGPSIADSPGVPTSTLSKFAATFQDILGSDTVGNGMFTDTGSAAWYRFHIKTFVAGDAPAVRVRRA